MKYLLDTNVLSDVVRKVPNVQRQFLCIDPALMCISALTIKEIQYGRAHDPERSRKYNADVDALLRDIKPIPLDVAEAYVTGTLRAVLARRGTPIGPFDSLIAGTALAHGLILVTANTREFSRVPQLRLENWRRPLRVVREDTVPYRGRKLLPGYLRGELAAQ
jgi:tRNA(fMet)-specific endonuclease VapC